MTKKEQTFLNEKYPGSAHSTPSVLRWWYLISAALPREWWCWPVSPVEDERLRRSHPGGSHKSVEREINLTPLQSSVWRVVSSGDRTVSPVNYYHLSVITELPTLSSVQSAEDKCLSEENYMPPTSRTLIFIPFELMNKLWDRQDCQHQFNQSIHR